MEQIINTINLIPALIGAIVGVVLTAIAAWHQINVSTQQKLIDSIERIQGD